LLDRLVAHDLVAGKTDLSTIFVSLGAEAAWGFSIRLPGGGGIGSAVGDALAGADAMSGDGSGLCWTDAAGGNIGPAEGVGSVAGDAGISCAGFGASATGAACCTDGTDIATGGTSGPPYDQITA